MYRQTGTLSLPPPPVLTVVTVFVSMSTMWIERLSGLALLHVYRDISIDTDKIVREFCARKHHSLVFEFCTQTFLWPYIFECHSTLSLHYSYWTEVGNTTFKLTDRNLKVQLTYFTGCETRVVYRCNCSNILVVGLYNAGKCPGMPLASDSGYWSVTEGWRMVFASMQARAEIKNLLFKQRVV